MQHNPTPRLAPGDLDDSFDQALLGLLLCEQPALWSLSELDRSLTVSDEARLAEEPSRHATEDAVQRLYAAGLIHRCGQFVFASRAAHVADRVNA